MSHDQNMDANSGQFIYKKYLIKNTNFIDLLKLLGEYFKVLLLIMVDHS